MATRIKFSHLQLAPQSLSLSGDGDFRSKESGATFVESDDELFVPRRRQNAGDVTVGPQGGRRVLGRGPAMPPASWKERARTRAMSDSSTASADSADVSSLVGSRRHPPGMVVAGIVGEDHSPNRSISVLSTATADPEKASEGRAGKRHSRNTGSRRTRSDSTQSVVDMVDGLLFEIYDRWHAPGQRDSLDSDTFTEYSSTSEAFLGRSDTLQLDLDLTHSTRLPRSYLESKGQIYCQC